MGLAWTGCLRRIRRLSCFGHQSRLPPPSVGWLSRPCATGQPPASSTFSSLTLASVLSDTGILPGCSGTFRGGRAGGAGAPVDDLGLVDDEPVVGRRVQAGR